METTYQSETTGVTGNPLGMDKELKFSGSTELDNGITVSVMQDTSDALAFGNSQISFGNVGGLQRFMLVLTQTQLMQLMILHHQHTKKLTDLVLVLTMISV